MDAEGLKGILVKIPLIPVLILWAIYLGWDYYGFLKDDTSPLSQKVRDIELVKTDIEKLKGKIKLIQDFKNNLEQKRVTLRNITQELESLKTTLSETLDEAEFIRSSITEAKRIGLTVLSLKPTGSNAREYYIEREFELKFRGVYVQLLIFLERLGNMQKIVRVDNFEMKPISSSSARYVELEGTLQLKAYRYLGSKADELAKKNEPEATNQTTPATREAPPANSGASPVPAQKPVGTTSSGGT
ncbi:MAG: hypothetical protein A2428_11550 [Bdellovibrionales bacterium RIFOXYC1_FULL_54_43]|nr:MAG: hypothetical protein A2428_11550 [Bdellovibrionales bacterium RIFOXYC1_FULL_54_43]OFZ79990.1 MAG: hypothetical protein A2603_02130 [Bdellovibrionales bacterium RIFOXYD1_FULL_55_31]